MITIQGEKGSKFSHQGEFPLTAMCSCGGEGRMAFVAYEGGKEESYICDLHENKGIGGLWPHDAIAVAVYFCKDCPKPIVIFNQA